MSIIAQYKTEMLPLNVEAKSPSDRADTLRTKISEFIALGTKVGILINPEERTVEVYRADKGVVTLGDGDLLTVPDLLPGWEVSVSDLWAPEFE